MNHTDTAFLELGVRFPSLEQAPGLSPWNPNQLDIWAAEQSPNRNAVHAARFLLNLWMPTQQWQCGHFVADDAIRDWDRAHRRAFLDWVVYENRLTANAA